MESKSEVLQDAEEKMKKAVAVNAEELASIRSGRATPAILNRITVDYYGTQVPLNQVANLSVPEPRLLVISPYDPNSIGTIEKAILASDLGITPNNDGSVIRLAFPELTEDRRKELVKVAHQRAEEGRVAIRNVRRHAKQQLERMKKDGTLPEDEERSAENQLQKLTDKYVAEVDAHLKRKEQELSEV
ncbi:MAG TPA: ribosome recycling factor [Actinomycetota bacterium]|jgi:ribosome recycling factor|nr:ribosome recycling factor [Actinomycetota bacterium]